MAEDTERISLPDGSWWEIRTVVSRRMRKEFRKAGLRGFASGLRNGHQVDWEDPEALRKAILSNPEAWDLDAVDDAYLLQGTIAWSRPEPFSLEAVDALPEALVAPVLVRMRAYYAEMPEAERQRFFGKP